MANGTRWGVARGEPIRHLVNELLRPPTDECILWPYALSTSGYGKLYLNGRVEHVHQLVCEMIHGPRREGMETAHSCHHRACFNPRHLSWKTMRDNQRDRVRDGTTNRGERHGLGKLTTAEVLEIRARYAAGGVSHAGLAAEYGVAPQSITAIINRQHWRHI